MFLLLLPTRGAVSYPTRYFATLGRFITLSLLSFVKWEFLPVARKIGLYLFRFIFRI